MTGTWDGARTAAMLRVPTAADDKYSRGVVQLVTGSDAFPGAAVLGTEAAWRAGAGMVRYSGPDHDGAGLSDAERLVLERRPETVLGRGRSGAWVIGSGIPESASARMAAAFEAVADAAETAPTVVVADAGAIAHLPEQRRVATIITPHDGEFARLCEQRGIARTDDRVVDARTAAAALDVVVLLKGSQTVIAAPSGDAHVVSEGPAWLATAGTGDVLAGALGALVAAHAGAPAPADKLAACASAAAWLHGRAARIASGAQDGAEGMPITALDVAEALPRAWAQARDTGAQARDARAGA